MQKKYDQLVTDCGKISWTEYKSSISVRWPISQLFPFRRRISYTFDVSSISDNLIDETDFKSNYHPNFNPLSLQIQRLVNNTLNKWEDACGGYIQFIYHSSFNEQTKGIQFAFSSGLTSYAQTRSHYVDGSGLLPEFNSVIISLPANKSGNFFEHAVSHEVGHSLGLNHLHEIPSLLDRLRSSPQGQGCSVMPYHGIVATDINQCNTSSICLDFPYAINPGPLDALICQNLYSPVDYILLSSVGKYVSYFSSVSLYNGGIENIVKQLLFGLRYKGETVIPPYIANSVSKCVTMPWLHQFNPYGIPVNQALVLGEVISELYLSNYSQTIKSLRIAFNLLTVMVFVLLPDHDDDLLTGMFLLSMLSIFNMTINMLGSYLGKEAARGGNYIIKHSERLVNRTSQLSWFRDNSTPPSTSDKPKEVASEDCSGQAATNNACRQNCVYPTTI